MASPFARTALSLALASLGLFVAPPASADTCSTDYPLVLGTTPEARLAFLSRAFDREIRDVDIWSWTWGSLYAGATVAQAALIPVESDHGVKTGLAVGAVSAGAGSLFLYVLPLQITLPLRGARARWNEGEMCQRLARAEHALATGAKAQALSSGPVPHIGNVLVNVGIALILGLGYGQWKSAAISAGVGTAIGEANAFTQPHRLPGVLERYRRGEIEGGGGGGGEKEEVSWWVGGSGGGGWGVGAGLTF